MDNPKIKIESDGNFVQIYLDGKKIKGQAIDFSFHADMENETINIGWRGEVIKQDEDGNCIFENGEVLTEKFHFDNHETEE